MKFGICYYPEHWPEDRWAADARWLRGLGVTIVRMAEFAWSRLEPEEGRFEFGWLDRAVAVFAAEGFEIVLGTPTAAPPDWLSQSYPSTLPVDDQGRRRKPGGRRHYCPNNAEYHAHTRRIVAALAERYGPHPAVRGWQIDNEFGGGRTARCYCPVCAEHFRIWLRARYGSLPALNAAWGTVFWSAEFHDWAHVEPPILNLATPNPSQVLDYYRFSSDSVTAYQQLQIDVLRATAPAAHFITHNFMGLYPDLDYFDLARALSLATWDSYPTGNAYRWRDLLYGADQPDAAYAFDVGDPVITGFAHDLTRGLLGKPFWIMEQQAGHVNWGAVNHLILPATVRLWTWHALAAGADAIVYFRERAALDAQEQYHSGLLHHDGTPDVGGRALETLQAERPALDALTAAPPRAAVALFWNYADLWSLQLQPHTKDFGYLRHLFVDDRALQRLGIPVDVVGPQSDLAAYRLVLAPTAHVVDEALAAVFEQYARAGGTLLLGVRSGFKTASNRVTDQPLPGRLRELVGAAVTDWGALPAGVTAGVAGQVPNLAGAAGVWIEALQPAAAEPRMWYADGPYQGRVAATEQAVGAGRVWYCGWPPSVAQTTALLEHLAAGLGLERLAELPAGLLAARRGAQTVLLNFTEHTLTGRVNGRAVAVPARDVRVVGA